ncbi:DUF4376 domain-containing protein [Laribacter hongkongensis]|uniref:DUF4376 domain-containing protein n=1 Tax=Laribacter hongkongensis TaxID=168471 RepID=UPI001EFCFAF4|nr:DUF4376 domain-containing protein [Laribacter hongkongensis]MCG8995057.1 DUF4376 domain-containing protein [Laribacter hongkongensis]MCG9011168.1 DUF4376 domain-containing protein [Laribacter hongkongensis]MCG9023567.1 DUF4376 domain-containing protein [Laribacter hongkongensis]MCG9047202.1 DUF4376 domain-containing protein [Laribacter hongkongensis]MCG9074600.1 DUF4376 domain-containing protein [Laribacter hongkongensis]
MPYYKDNNGGVHFLDSADYESLLPAGCTQISDTEAAELLAPEPEPLDALRDRALELLPAWEKSERASGIEHAGQRWLTTSAALQDIRDVLLAGAVPNEQWVTADRQIVPLTFTELQSLWQAITARGAQIYQRRLEMEQQIAGMDREQLEAFQPGWPVPEPAP